MSEVSQAVEALVRRKYPNEQQELVPGVWFLAQGAASALVMASDSEQGYSYVRVIVPLAVDIPPSAALDAFMARVGRSYEIGRFFLCDRADQQATMAVVEEFIPGILLEGANPSGLKLLWNVIGSLLLRCDDPGAGGYIRATFGGRPLDQRPRPCC